MRLPLILILPLLALGVLVDWYIVRAVWLRCTWRPRLCRRVALWSSVAFLVMFTTVVIWPKTGGADRQLDTLMWALFAYFSVYMPKYIFCLFDLIAKIPQLWHRHRWTAVTVAGAVLATAVCGLMWWGALVNRYRIDVKRVEITDNNLPDSFNGLTIAQISDLHTGTYGTDTAFVAKLVDAVNALHPDMVVFTGDIVNRHSAEFLPFTGALSRLHAPMGVYSILGNHDYGDYYRWPSEDAKSANLAMLDSLERAMGWNLLRNETAFMHRGTDSIAVVGVENIGDPPFHRYGDLSKSYPGSLSDPTFKVLLSHNPAHWVNDICDDPLSNIALTLAGHTHAMQVELFGLSPARWRYRTWGGLYPSDDGSKQLYVNIGAGEVGIPARIGATPEITLITLRK